MADSVKNLEFVAPEERAKKIGLLVDYFFQDARRRQTRNYFWYFIFYQVFYIFNTGGQIYFTNLFLNNQFLFLVPSWLGGEPVLDRVFPMQAKCTYQDYGAAGDLQKHDFLCVLAMNILIRKLYVMLWFLLSIALLAAVYQLFYIIKMIISVSMRRKMTKDKEFLDQIHCSEGDCLLLMFFRESVDCVTYAEFKKLALLKLPTIVQDSKE